jgi:hypothetical protein
MGGFCLAVSHFLRREDCVIDFLGQTPKGRLWAACYLLASSSNGVIRPPSLGVEVRGVDCVADWWAGPSLSARVALDAGGS